MNNDFIQPQPGDPSSSSTTTIGSTLPTYLSLIQQYLAIFMNENAVFLAERCVAEHPHHPDAIYMLALCHYRSRRFRRAKFVLDSVTLSNPNHHHHPNPTCSPAMRYLSAQCSFELHDYALAEDVLMKQCRMQYVKSQQQQAAAPSHKNKNNNQLLSQPKRTIEQWILETSPCPVPNGAAGLALLGKICRKSTRHQQAITYFQLSLQLDPFLFSSFEALCELGVQDLQPSSIFGVDPVVEAERLILLQPPSTSTSTTPLLPSDHFPKNGDFDRNPTAFQNSPMTPTMPTMGGRGFGGGEGQGQRVGAFSSTTTTTTTPSFAATPSVTHSLRTRPTSRYSTLETPDLTPIPVLHASQSLYHHHHHHPTVNTNSETATTTPLAPESSSSFQRSRPVATYAASSSYLTRGSGGGGSFIATGGTPPPLPQQLQQQQQPRPRPHPAVMKRARAVASRIYYPPSPDSSSSIGSTPTPTPTPAPIRTIATLTLAAPATTPLTSLTQGFQYLQGLGGTSVDQSSSSRIRSSIHSHSQDEQQQWSHPTYPSAHPTLLRSVPPHSSNSTGRSLFTTVSENQQPFHSDEWSSTTVTSTPVTSNGLVGVGTSSTMIQMERCAGTSEYDDDDVDVDGGNSNKNNTEKLGTIQGNHTVYDVSVTHVAAVLELLSLCGTIYHKQCQFHCRQVLETIRHLPEKHQLTGWGLYQQGRAYLELNQFHEARKSLELMSRIDPGRLRGLELLSTVYWQLRKEVELAYLSQRVTDLDRLSPETWCVVGNCFSLQKDHESALIFFKRSLQLDSDFTYTHTLCGYEYMANENFDKAIACFRQALRIDERHYNAWYGLGAIYHRQEKYDSSEYHFGMAVSINPCSSVLRCNLGIALNANGKPYQALETLAAAFELDPRNPQARFQRATIYSTLNRPEEALEELRKVRDAAPREATVFFAMGKVLKRLGRSEEAMKCYLTAMDLDPKDNQMIKSAMDKLDEPDVDDESKSAF